ncbi:ABC transporter permease [Paenibacillus sp. UMB4589-SE434]|uniref:ABC transporter permease n=1 Tax=Paenibacillus sp. UMB4589-SE434 TaxID=3046314 RepID=UPI00254BB751|nr:ABC transporter permease [Paenibacillus sp. UMB4589-SE434]MDK8182804.1 ABC transporter permease [Paenibacillus sp. UMB4589-SE434]
MMRPWPLAYRRWRLNLNYQWNALRIVMDWTVMLYIIVPALLLGLKFYYSWWTDAVVIPQQSLFQTLWIYPFFVTIMMSRVRTWSEGGDILFLRQHPVWYETFVRFGLLELAVRQTLLTGALTILLLPWLIRGYHFDTASVIMLSLLAGLIGCLHALVRNQITVRMNGWKRVVWGWIWNVAILLAFRYIIISMLSYLFAGAALAGLLIICIYMLARWRIHVRYTFDRDVDVETGFKMKLTSLLLKQALGKQPRRKRGKKPLLFPHSGYWKQLNTAGERIGAIAVKTMWRSSVHVLFYCQLIGVGMIALFIVTLKAASLLMLVFPVLCAILGYWLNSYWRELVGSEVWKMYTFDVEQVQIGASHFVKVNGILPGMLWGAASGWLISPVAGILYMAGGAVVSAFISNMVMMMRGYKLKEDFKVEAEQS